MQKKPHSAFAPIKTVKRMSVLLISILCSILICCSRERMIQAEHVQGTLAYKSGDWNKAVMHFFEAGEAAEQLSENEMRSYTDFALASSYLMQGEDKAASEKLRQASGSASDLLRSYCFYQKGIIAFREKDYMQAAALFKQSLELTGADQAAKINYELSKKMCSRQNENQYGAPQNTVEESPAGHDEDSIILDIIRKREQAEWKKTQHETEPAVNDY